MTAVCGANRPKIARWLAGFHGLKAVHDQRGWDALIAIG